jgi:uncharacterized protein (TIGR00290 family)
MSIATKTVMNWSTGKDASLAYHLLTAQSVYEVTHLLTTLSEEHERVFMHGVREQLLDMQAERMGLPLIKVKLPASPKDDLYKTAMLQTMQTLKEDGVTAAAYGDIFLEDLRKYRVEQLAQVEITGVFPLWKRDTRDLVQLVAQSGIEAVIVCVNDEYLSKEFLGRKMDASFLADLPDNVDPCGENGEYHTFVYNAPFFSSPIDIRTGETVYRSYKTTDDEAGWDSGFYFLDIQPV